MHKWIEDIYKKAIAIAPTKRSAKYIVLEKKKSLFLSMIAKMCFSPPNVQAEFYAAVDPQTVMNLIGVIRDLEDNTPTGTGQHTSMGWVPIFLDEAWEEATKVRLQWQEDEYLVSHGYQHDASQRRRYRQHRLRLARSRILARTKTRKGVIHRDRNNNA